MEKGEQKMNKKFDCQVGGVFPIVDREWLLLNMASRVLIKNPKNGRQAWFSLPLYLGKNS